MLEQEGLFLGPLFDLFVLDMASEPAQASLAQRGRTQAELRRNLEREMIASRLRSAPVGVDVDLDQLHSRANIVWSDDSLRQLYEQGLRLRR